MSWNIKWSLSQHSRGFFTLNSSNVHVITPHTTRIGLGSDQFDADPKLRLAWRAFWFGGCRRQQQQQHRYIVASQLQQQQQQQQGIQKEVRSSYSSFPYQALQHAYVRTCTSTRKRSALMLLYSWRARTHKMRTRARPPRLRTSVRAYPPRSTGRTGTVINFVESLDWKGGSGVFRW